MKPLIALFLSLLFGFQPLYTVAQQSNEETPEELPEALGIYFLVGKKMSKWGEVGIRHTLEKDKNRIKLYSRPNSSIPNVKSGKPSFLTYFSFGSKNPEDFRLYRLKPQAAYKPEIIPEGEVELSFKPIVGKPGILGNMVQIIPEVRLTKNNYILTEGDIYHANSGWMFKIEDGYPLWKKKPHGCVQAFGIVVLLVIGLAVVAAAQVIANTAVSPD